jgi:hypothetical protein
MTPSPSPAATQTVIGATPPLAPPPPAAPVAAAPPAPPVDAAAFQRQIDELKEQVAEGQRTAQYWADKAKAGAPAKPAEVHEDEPDVLETITTKGAKGLDELLAKRGYVRGDEVDARVNARASTLVKEQELIAQYPDLRKKDSEFFKATAMHYGDLVKSGTPQALAMELAAQKTELEFMRSGKIKLPGAEPTKEEKEAARLARIAAQSGDGGGRRPAAASEEDEDLTPEQKHIADAMGISHEAYSARAKKGVAIKGHR